MSCRGCAGDFNTHANGVSIRPELTGVGGFTDVLHTLGVAVPTLTWTKKGVSDNSWAIVDHVFVHGSRITPIDGVTHTSGLWRRFPAGLNREFNAERMCESLRATGTDHMPVSAVVDV